MTELEASVDADVASVESDVLECLASVDADVASIDADLHRPYIYKFIASNNTTKHGVGANSTITILSRPFKGKHNSIDVDPIRSPFKFQERTQSSRNLELQFNQNEFMHGDQSMFSLVAPRKKVMNASPLSTFETFLA
ncbi:hypothetical protein POM88_043611 [Heracleum sosnowskyi]|uniref:Uncharacterized protein n=1 Tax=Heracleum sosnowskyi TaxID=360622 RepID=A0AAD8H1C2_9APIA|nr:hypothetical protein POM88_043611 [Heracleum sosnowskyi]